MTKISKNNYQFYTSQVFLQLKLKNQYKTKKQFSLNTLGNTLLKSNQISPDLAYKQDSELIPKEIDLPIIKFGSAIEAPYLFQTYKENLERIKLLVQYLSDIINKNYSLFYFEENCELSQSQILKKKNYQQEIMKYIFNIQGEEEISLIQVIHILRADKMDQDLRDHVMKKIDQYTELVKKVKLINFPSILDIKNSEEIFINFFLGLSLKSAPKIIDSFKKSRYKIGGCIMQSIYVWEKLTQISNNQDFIKENSGVIAQSIHFIIVYIYCLINDTNLQFQATQKTLQNLPSQTDFVLERIENDPYIKECMEILLSDEGTITPEFSRQINSFTSKKDIWSSWLYTLQLISSQDNGYAKNNKQAQQSMMLLESIISGQFFFDQMIKQDYTKYFMDFYLEGQKIVDEVDCTDLNKIPSIEPFGKKLFKGKQNLLPLFDQFLKMFVGIQKVNTNKNKTSSFIIQCIIDTIQIVLTQNQSHDAQQMEQVIKTLLYFLTNYDLTNLPKDKEFKQIVLTHDEQLAKFQEFVNLTIFDSPDITRYFNGQNLVQIYHIFKQICDQQDKNVQNPEFQESFINFIECIAKGRESSFVGLPTEIIRSIFGITNGDLDSLIQLLYSYQIIDSNKVILLQKIIDDVKELKQKSDSIAIYDQKEQSADFNQILQRMKEGTASSEDLFKYLDKDKSGYLSKEEFQLYCRRRGLNLSDHRINEIFAYIKKTSTNKQSMNELDPEEFNTALQQLESRNSEMCLDQLGFSLHKVMGKVAILGSVILLILLFILIGIQAFSIGGSFGAVVNSSLPVVGGVSAVNSQKKELVSEQKLEKVIVKVKKILQTE